MVVVDAHEIRLISRTAFPLVAANLAQRGTRLIDTIMMGWLGPAALAAGALSTTLFVMALVFCMGTLSAVGVSIAHARGARRDDEVGAVLRSGVHLTLLLAVPFTLGVWYAPDLLGWLGQGSQVVEVTRALLHGLAWGFPGYLLFLVFREFVSAFSLTNVVLVASVLSIPATFAADYGFIYGAYGLPKLGVAGIGYAGAGIMWLMFLYLLWYSWRNPLLRPYLAALRKPELDWRQMRDILRLGSSSGLLLVLDNGMFSVAALMMSSFGVSALAAHQVAIQCATIAYSAPVAVSMATALHVGHAAGTGDLAQAKRYTYIGMAMGLLIAVATALFFLLAPQTLAGFFLQPGEPNYREIDMLTVSFLAASALFQSFDALQTIMNGALRGLKDTFVPMLLCIGCYWFLGIGSSYYLAFHTPAGAVGIWYGMIIGIFSAAVVVTLRFVQQIRSRGVLRALDSAAAASGAAS